MAMGLSKDVVVFEVPDDRTFSMAMGLRPSDGPPPSLGFIADASGDKAVEVRSPLDSWIIGLSQNPLIHQGDALDHIAIAANARGLSSMTARTLVVKRLQSLANY